MSLLSTRRRLAARTHAQQASRCACCEDAPPSVPLGALLLAATELPQVALARLEQRGDVHLAIGRRRHRRHRDQLSAACASPTPATRRCLSRAPVHREDVTDLWVKHAEASGNNAATGLPRRTPLRQTLARGKQYTAIARRWFVLAFCRLRLGQFPSG